MSNTGSRPRIGFRFVNSLNIVFISSFFCISRCVQEVEGPFRCNGGVKSITLNPKKKSSQAIPNLPRLVPRMPIGMPTRIVKQIAPPF